MRFWKKPKRFSHHTHSLGSYYFLWSISNYNPAFMLKFLSALRQLLLILSFSLTNIMFSFTNLLTYYDTVIWSPHHTYPHTLDMSSLFSLWTMFRSFVRMLHVSLNCRFVQEASVISFGHSICEIAKSTYISPS